MAKTVAVLLYCAAALGVIGLLVYWEVWWRTPEAQRARLQRSIKKHCRRMEAGKAKLSKLPLACPKCGAWDCSAEMQRKPHGVKP